MLVGRHFAPATAVPSAWRTGLGKPVGHGRTRPGRRLWCSSALVVDAAQQLVSGLRDVVVVVLRRPLLSMDQTRPVDLLEVPIRESEPALGLLGGALIDGEVPLPVALIALVVDDAVCL